MKTQIARLVFVLFVLSGISGCGILVAALASPGAPKLSDKTLYPNIIVTVVPLKAAGPIESVNHQDAWLKSPYPVDAVKGCGLFDPAKVTPVEGGSDLVITQQLIRVRDIGCQGGDHTWDLSVQMRLKVRDTRDGTVLIDKEYGFASRDGVILCSQSTLSFGGTSRQYVTSEKGLSPNRAYSAIFEQFLRELNKHLEQPRYQERQRNNAKVEEAVKAAAVLFNKGKMDEALAVVQPLLDKENVNPMWLINLLQMPVAVYARKGDYAKAVAYGKRADHVLARMHQGGAPLYVMTLETLITAQLGWIAVITRDAALVADLKARHQRWWNELRSIDKASIGSDFVTLKGDNVMVPVNQVAGAFVRAWSCMTILSLYEKDSENATRYAAEAHSAALSLGKDAPLRGFMVTYGELMVALADAARGGRDLAAAAKPYLPRFGGYPGVAEELQKVIDALR